MRLSKDSAARWFTTILVGAGAPVVLLAQMPSQIPDTVQAECAVTDAAPVHCALARLARRVQARQGAMDSLHYSPASAAFLDPAGHTVVEAHVRLLTEPTRVLALALFTPESAPPVGGARTTATGATPPVVWPPPPPRAAEKSVAARRVAAMDSVVALARPAPVPAAVFLVRGPRAPEPVVIARETPVALRFRLYRIVAADSTLAMPRKAECVTRKTRGLEVVQTKIAVDGELTCWVRLTQDADTVALARLTARIETTDRKTVTVDASVRPVAVPRYAVEVTSPACKPLADRVLFLLRQRGVPVVDARHATRVVALDGCDNIARLLPTRTSDAVAQGMYLRGTLSEVGLTVYESPEYVGPFEVTVLQPGLEPQAVAALEVLERLLRYRTL